MNTLTVPENFDVNFLQCLFQGMKSDINDSKNRLGFSSHQYCKRKVILSKIHGKKFEGNVKTLLGQIYETCLYLPEVLQLLRERFSEKLGIKTPYAMIPNRSDEVEILPDRFLRIHPDILSAHYVIEVKTTAVYKKIWRETLASYQMTQLNGYLGHYKIKQGFLHAVDVRVFLSQSKKGKDTYWDYLWNEFGHNIPWTFNKDLYVKSIERIKEIFGLIDIEDADVDAPEMSFECKGCVVMEECGKSEWKCRERNDKGVLCQNKMYEWKSCLTDKFVNRPICLPCWTREHPRTKPEQYTIQKYTKNYPWEEN